MKTLEIPYDIKDKIFEIKLNSETPRALIASPVIISTPLPFYWPLAQGLSENQC